MALLNNLGNLQIVLFQQHHESMAYWHDAVIEPDAFFALKLENNVLKHNKSEKVRGSLFENVIFNFHKRDKMIDFLTLAVQSGVGRSATVLYIVS